VPHDTSLNLSAEALVRKLRADPTLRRADRIAIGFSMQEDGFAARDIARIASLRWSTVVELRRALGLPERPRGAAATNVHAPHLYPAPRALSTVVAVLMRSADLRGVAARLQIGELTAYGIRRAIEYAWALEATPNTPGQFRCPECEQRGPAHPCAHCGHAWLQAAA
jgi:hypothetical protein